MPRRHYYTETMVRTYPNALAFKRDAEDLAIDGWRVKSVTQQQPNPGCMRGCLLGLLALVFKPKPYLLVTYEVRLLDDDDV